MSEPEAIKASDLMKLMEVVKVATGLYNAVELMLPEVPVEVAAELVSLQAALHDLGLREVT